MNAGRRLLVVGGSVVVALLVSGCSGGSSDSSLAGGQSSEPSDSVSQGDVGFSEEMQTEDEGVGESPFSGELELGSVTLADLDQSLIVFIECVRPGLDGAIRVNFDRYLDFSADFTLPDGRNDPQASSQIWDDCDQKSGFSEKDFAYRRANRLSVEQIREIATEFEVCAEGAGLDPSSFAPIDGLDSSDDLEKWRDSFYLQAPASEIEDLFNCGDSVFYGPKLEF